MKKAFTAFLALVLALSMMMGIAVAEEEKELITVTLAVNTQTPDPESTHIVKYLEDNFKIKLKVLPFKSDDWSQQLTLMMAEDNLPDIVCNLGMTFAEFNKYANQGYFLNITPYIDSMPNFKAMLEAYPSYGLIMTNVDGNIYGLSQLTTINQNAPARIFIDERWLENVGMEVPTDVDELYDVLVAFKEQDANGNGDSNDEIPMYLNADYNNRNNTFRYLANAFGLPLDTPTSKLCMDENGKIYAPWNTENWKALLEYLHKLYEEELIDTNYVVRTSAEFKEYVKNATVGLFGANAPFAQGGFSMDYDANFQYGDPLKSEFMDKATLVLTSGASTNVTVAINAKTEHADRIMEFIDWVYTTEGAFNVGMGIKDLDWFWNYTKWSDEHAILEMYCPEGYANSNEYKTNACIINGAFSLYSPADGRNYKIIDVVDDDTLYNDETLVEAYGWAVLVEQGIREAEDTVEAMTTLTYTEEESVLRASLVTDIKTYVDQMITQFISGERDFEAGWDEYVATLESMGIDQWVELDQTAYDRMAG